RERTLEVANHLIASSTDILFSIVNLSLPRESKVDRGEEFSTYVNDALDMDQVDVDSATIRYLEMAIEALKIAMGSQAESQLESAKSDLKGYVKLQERAHKKPSPEEKIAAYQKMADHLFSQVFKKLLSLINAHRDALYKKFRQARSDANE